jgi:nitrogen fixation NifU-like protein
MEDALAQDILLDHFKKPRRRGTLPSATLRKSGLNPACGDRVELTGAVKDGRWELRTDGSGCVISQASASMMTAALGGREVGAARALAGVVLNWLAGRGAGPDFSGEGLEDLEALEGTRRHASRAKCACLAWELFLEGTLDGADGR